MLKIYPIELVEFQLKLSSYQKTHCSSVIMESLFLWITLWLLFIKLAQNNLIIPKVRRANLEQVLFAPTYCLT